MDWLWRAGESRLGAREVDFPRVLRTERSASHQSASALLPRRGLVRSGHRGFRTLEYRLALSRRKQRKRGRIAGTPQSRGAEGRILH